jgi:SAM-dependent methyltransferase
MSQNQNEKNQRLGRGAEGQYYLQYNAESLTFPRNVFHQPKLKAARDLAAALPDKARVLDAGCSTGYVSRGLSPRLRLTGVDIEKEAVEFCRTHREGEFLEADLTALPFAPDTFDLILFTNTIEHLENPHPILGELIRVLKPGGKILITTENCANLFWLILEQTWYRIFGGPCKPYMREVHPQRYTPALLREHVGGHVPIATLTRAMLGMELVLIAEKKPGSDFKKNGL